ncbi:hypothetical protein F5Y16DRAFT_389448 [Xylariaceae sp. FL0255]|nr:hypothetical protein F5Y16DRAFT_389448 [Xylariaceae sp. FL0255]
MSPVASTGTATVAPTSTSSKMTSFTAKPGAGGPRKNPFRHIDDILCVTVDIDPHTPLHKVLEAGDAHMRQAITFNSFDRPDLALQEYIKAFTIAVDKVPKHKDYPSLKSDRGDLGRLYHALKTKITANGATFDQVKEQIKEDNLRSGVRSTRSSDLIANLPSVPSGLPSSRPSSSSGSNQNGHRDSGEARRAKPAVHSKPQALHGNPITPSSGTAVPDLTARFAKLRNPQESQTRHSLDSLPKPDGTRNTTSLNTTVPSMPKIPDAIYSPARGTVTSELANLPSSTPRGMFSRTNSAVSIPSSSPRISMESIMTEQFAAAHTYGDMPRTPSSAKIRVPRGDVISVTELVRCMGYGESNLRILLIDVRDRQAYDDGHIMSQHTICVDPTILSRDDISADEIVDSMILATTKEKIALEERDQADMVVFYDQSSDSIPTRKSGNAEEKVLYNLQQALSHYSDIPLKHSPKLLVGGLDAWINKMGEQSLATSSTQSVAKNNSGPSARTLQRLRHRALKPDETNNFEAIIGRDKTGLLSYARTPEEFMKRFPSIKAEPESMVSERTSGEEFLKDIEATPPVRPKPSKARTTYSGLESTDEQPTQAGLGMMATAGGRDRPTGLHNPGNWCYGNAAIQMLAASRGFVDELIDPKWPGNYRPQAPLSHPSSNQLMCKIMGNLLHWLTRRLFPSMEMTTLMQYLRSIHSGYRDGNRVIKFGDRSQHDSDELILFLFAQLSAETRIPLIRTPVRLNVKQPLDFVTDAWLNRDAHTIIHKHWHTLGLQITECLRCRDQTFLAPTQEGFRVQVPDHSNSNIQQAFQEAFNSTQVEATCDKCNSKQKRMTNQLARLPPLLRVQLDRNTGQPSKNTNHVQFPVMLDLTSFALPGPDRAEIERKLGIGTEAGSGFNVPTRYQLYGVVTHAGPNPNSGHYMAYVNYGAVKDRWWVINDDAVHHFNGIKRERVDLSKFPGDPTQLYYRRIDVVSTGVGGK